MTPLSIATIRMSQAMVAKVDLCRIAMPPCRITGLPDYRFAGLPICRITGLPDYRFAGLPAHRTWS
jgi:hypothetical protein